MQLIRAGYGQVVACKNGIGRGLLPKCIQRQVGILTNDQIEICVKRIQAVDFLQRATQAMGMGLAALLPFKLPLSCFPELLQTPVALIRPFALAGCYGVAAAAFCKTPKLTDRVTAGTIGP